MSSLMKPIHDARIKVRISDMVLNKIKPTIRRSADGHLRSYVTWKADYQTNFTFQHWNEAAQQGELVLSDLEACVRENPLDFVSVMGIDQGANVVDMFLYHRPSNEELMRRFESEDVFF